MQPSLPDKIVADMVLGFKVQAPQGHVPQSVRDTLQEKAEASGMSLTRYCENLLILGAVCTDLDFYGMQAKVEQVERIRKSAATFKQDKS